MPLAMPYHLTRFATTVRNLRPQRVLEIGPGFGLLGVICRQYLDIEAGRYERERWVTRIDAIELNGAYLTPLTSYVYDEIVVADARTFDFGERQYDLVILGDVIEHMTKDEGRALLARLPGDRALVSTPLIECEQKGRPYSDVESERHRSMWTQEDFVQLDGWSIETCGEDRYIYSVLLARKL